MELYLKSPPPIIIATNIFINVPVILQYEDTPLIEVIEVKKKHEIAFTTQISIFHSDGVKLAKVKGNRVYPTEAGKKVNIKIKETPAKCIVSLENKTIIELSHGKGNEFKAEAELYVPDRYLVKCSDSPVPELFNINGNAITIDGIITQRSIFKNIPIGIWIGKNSIQIGKQVYTGRHIP